MLKVLDEACTPTKGSKFSACIDLRASEDVVIGAGETKMIGLGVCIDEDELIETALHDIRTEQALYPHIDYTRFCSEEKYEMFKKANYLQLMLRSSLGKKGLILPNGVGIIDMDYRDEIKMIIHNPIKRACFGVNEVGKYDFEADVWQEYEIKKGDRIAQITLLEHKAYLFGIDTEEERDGGFGSTDKKDFYDLKNNDEEDGRNL